MIKCCNMCGKQMNVWDIQQGISIRKQMGYGSEHDGEYLALDLCSECIDKVIDELFSCFLTSALKSLCIDKVIDELSVKCKIPIIYGSKRAYKIKEIISEYKQHNRIQKTD